MLDNDSFKRIGFLVPETDSIGFWYFTSMDQLSLWTNVLAKRRLAAEANAKAARIAAGAEAKAAARRFALRCSVEAKDDPGPSTEHSTNIYGHSQQYYHHQKAHVAYQQKLLSDRKRFPSFPRHLNGNVIVGTHPNFAPPQPSEVIGDKNIEESTGILHRKNKMANQYVMKMEKHHASPLNRCCYHLNRLTSGIHSVSLITPMTYFPPR